MNIRQSAQLQNLLSEDDRMALFSRPAKLELTTVAITKYNVYTIPDYLLGFIPYFCFLLFLLTGHLYGVGLIVPDGGCDAKTLNMVCNLFRVEF